VLGCLIEKGITTPDYYPITLNGLTLACNQKSNRDPVVLYDDKIVKKAFDSLREKELTRVVSGPDMRVPKHYHRFPEVMRFSEPEVAILCELMLRGPQTPGELRSRATRMCAFENLEKVQLVLNTLLNRKIILELPRQPGLKETRFTHSFGDPAIIENTSEKNPSESSIMPGEVSPEATRTTMIAEDERMDRLEESVTKISNEIASLRSQFEEFKRQFE